MEYSISLQALFPFEIGIQALIQFVVLFDIQFCLVSRAYWFCLSKSSEINRFAGLYFLHSYLSSSSQNLLCDFSAAAAKYEVESFFSPEKWHSWKMDRINHNLEQKKKLILSNSRIKSLRGMDGCKDFSPQFFYSCGFCR